MNVFLKAPAARLLALAFLIMAPHGVATAAEAAGDAAAGERSFAKCASCHSVTHTGHRMGPHLMGLAGRKVGSVEGFRYSPAMQEAGARGETWTDDLMARFFYNPGKTIPGNAMRFFGLWSETEIRNIIAYLKTIEAPEKP